MAPQGTIAKAVTISGVGVHSGSEVHLKLLPAAPDTGIVFRRTDRDIEPSANRLIPAHIDYVVGSFLGTTIRNEQGVSVATVEHLLAALAGCAVDNLIVEIDGPEVPIIDGSARPFIEIVLDAGIQAQESPRRYIRVLQTVAVHDGDRLCEVVPDQHFSVDVRIDYPDTVIGSQRYVKRVMPDTFRDEIANARTFGFMEDVDKLRAAGRAHGASLENTVVVHGDKVVNSDGLRCEDEFVRHKVLDAIGDFALLGAPLLGRLRSVRGGHEMNHRLMRKLLSQTSAWELSQEPSTSERPAEVAVEAAQVA